MGFPASGLPGIDVSHYQGTVDWKKVAAGGEAFAYAKASESCGGADPYFADNWASIKSVGMLRGAYHFFHPDQDPAKQAQVFLAALSKANGSPTLAPGDLPATLDLEVTAGERPADILAGAKVWLTIVEQATGRKPLLYTFTNFWKSQLGNPSTLSEYPLWVAEYGCPAPVPIGGWQNYTIWQFGQQPIPGVTGSPTVDVDSFQGTAADLRALAGL